MASSRHADGSHAAHRRLCCLCASRLMSEVHEFDHRRNQREDCDAARGARQVLRRANQQTNLVISRATSTSGSTRAKLIGKENTTHITRSQKPKAMTSALFSMCYFTILVIILVPITTKTIFCLQLPQEHLETHPFALGGGGRGVIPLSRPQQQQQHLETRRKQITSPPKSMTMASVSSTTPTAPTSRGLNGIQLQHQQVDWAQRIPTKSAVVWPLEHQQPQLAIHLGKLMTNRQPQQRQQHEIYSPPRVLSTRVVNGGQRLLKNLANATSSAIGDLVSAAQQQQHQLASLNQPLQQFRPQEQMSSPQSTRTLAEAGLVDMSPTSGSRLLPTMNKLYNFLFASSGLPLMSPLVGGANSSNITTDKQQVVGQSRESMISAASINKDTMARNTKSVGEPKALLNLTAPYEPRSRSRRLMSNSSSSNGSEKLASGKLRRTVGGARDLRASEQTSVMYSDQDSGEHHSDEHMASDPSASQGYELEDQYTSMGNTSGAEEHPNYAQYGSNQPQLDSNEPEVRYVAGDVEDGEQQHHHLLPHQQEYGDEQMQTNGGDPSASQLHEGEQYEQQMDHQHQQPLDGHPDQSDGDFGLSHHQQQQQAASGQESYESDGESYPQRQHQQDDGNGMEEISSQRHNFTISDSSGGGENMTAANSGEYQLPDSRFEFQQPNQSSASMQSNLMDDESALAVQLPSQYDSAIRLPPDGYYDDYFKPATSNLASASATSSLPSAGENLNPGADLMSALTPTSSDFQPASHEDLAGSERHSASNRTHELVSSTPTGGSMDYMAQFYLHQAPLRQHQVANGGDNNIEFLTSNRSSDARRHKAPQDGYVLGSAHSDQQHNETHESNALVEMRPPANATDHREPKHQVVAANRTLSGRHNHQGDEAIEIILANTNSSRDPLSNEKFINYISEGRNVSLAAGKSPRITFVNRDMNEFPAVDNFSGGQNQGNSSTEAPSRYVTLTTMMPTTSSQQIDEANGQEFVARLQSSEQQTGHQENGEQTDDLLRTNSIYSTPGHQQQQQQVAEEPEDEPQQQHLQAKERSSGGNRERKQRQYNHNNNVHPNGQQPHRHTQKMRQQQTIRRPQVTQAQFNPKDLILQAPTAMPSVTESTMNSIANMPAKVKKLHENQPDKNELMNELLTALDKVKAAIYKLQPLTAKMNAMYRKSITSNTRDIIMDHHKGTYAKRYPPGDYDDAYDRMHPSELLERNSNQQQRQREARNRRAGRSSSGADMETSGSGASPVYLPAPVGLANSTSNKTSGGRRARLELGEASESMNLSESQLVATGVGRRLGNGRIVGQLSLSSGSERIVYDDDDDGDGDEARAGGQMSTRRNGNTTRPYAASKDFRPEQLVGDEDSSSVQSPLFGYRITIFQAPDPPAGMAAEDAEIDTSQPFAYQVDGLDSLVDEFGQRKRQANQPQVAEGDDAMATSESSISESTNFNSRSGRGRRADVGDGGNDESEPSDGSGDDGDDSEAGDDSVAESSERMAKRSKKKSKSKEAKKGKKMGKEEEQKKKSAKESAEKKNEKKGFNAARKREEEEEKKKRKEYKRIKHNKGILSKEKKSMHRDKHIKAHDRGAAKEKALKERTQIEFFEREQIVDDEFEKAKKSTMKAGWQGGHEAKKSSKEMLGGDTMSMGGSHYVKHDAPSYSEKGHGLSAESASSKESNKFEKKNIEAKGKKFKGWREKGYKIITETEFIDRGSLHDSAYKKRDKGAAQHQKYKKQESMSEGHHGSMQEHMKKLHKKEDKKSEMEEKKKEEMKKEEKEAKKKEKAKKEKEEMMKKEKKKKKKDVMAEKYKDHELEESAATVEPLSYTDARILTTQHNPLPGQSRMNSLMGDSGANNHLRRMNQPQLALNRPQQVVLMSANSSVFKSIPNAPPYQQQQQHFRQQQPESLARLLNANHDDDLNSFMGIASNSNSSGDIAILAHKHRNPELISRYQTWGSNSTDSLRRSDGGSQQQQQQRTPSTISPSANQVSGQLQVSNGTTILDIVDSLTGRQLNKTKIGTYELEDQQQQQSSGRASQNSSGVSASPLGRFVSSNLAKLSQASNKSPQSPPTSAPESPPRGQALNVSTPKLVSSTNNLSQPPPQQLHPAARLLKPAPDKQLQPVAVSPPISSQSNKLAEYPPETRNLSPDATDSAIQLLQLIQRASQMSSNKNNLQLMDTPFDPFNHQVASGHTDNQLLQQQHQQQHQNAIDKLILAHNHQQQQHQLLHQQAPQFHQQPPTAIFAPTQLSALQASSGTNSFNPNQFIDYDQESLLSPATLGFLADS